MLKEILPYGELLLLVVLTILQLGRWSQKREDTPQSLARDLTTLKQLEEKHYEEFRRHRHDYNNFLQNVDYKNDRRYVRRDVYEAEKKAIVDKQESDCERLSELETWRNRFVGIS
jgi:hypothetical protein